MTTKKDNWDSEENEIPSNWVKFYVPMEDKIFGTLIAKRIVKSNYEGKEDEDSHVYEMKADVGSFHNVDAKKVVIPEPVTINAGEIWNIGGKDSIDKQMRNVKVGQKIGFKFIDEKESRTKGWNPAKNIRVYAPKNDDGTPQMDTAWLEEYNSVEVE
jgi:hypothetical protein|tara:strand:+ start:2165 stop:2635 length:471 start_codon:yes stop_codon:yes gene_type:complete